VTSTCGDGAPRHRPGDQPPPQPGTGPPIHDLVIADLTDAGLPPAAADAVTHFISARKLLGLRRYGQYLQAFNSRSWRQDMQEELADAAAYARQGLEELPPGPEADVLHAFYLCLLRQIARLVTPADG
jgi:hypothetical protein